MLKQISKAKNLQDLTKVTTSHAKYLKLVQKQQEIQNKQKELDLAKKVKEVEELNKRTKAENDRIEKEKAKQTKE